MPEWINLLKPLLTQGVLGCVCLVQALVIRRLYSDLEDAREETVEAVEARADSLERALASRPLNGG